jgi:hypothetical protein
MTEKKTESWKDRPVAEKTALIIGWGVVALIMVYWFLPSKSAPTEPSQSIVSEVQPPTAQHTRASAQALTSATQYLSQLDNAMAEGIHILKANQLPELAAHSQVFKSLLEAGHVQFGRSVFQPLGRCSAAAVFANSWWQAQISASRQGGTESVPGSIQSSLDEYSMNRGECLKQADPSTNVASVIEKHTHKTESTLEC